MQLLEQNDIQGLVARGYGKLTKARFVLLKIKDAKATKEYLKSIADQVNTVSVSPKHFALQIAFTSQGLKELAIPDDAYHSFSREFIEGMSEPFRTLILGDQSENSPDNWIWGGPGNPVHLLLLCYAKDSDHLDNWFKDSKNDFSANGMSVMMFQETNDKLPESKEHFGFRDGISNPSLNGFKPQPKEGNLNPGEFVLGYPDEYKIISQRPAVSSAGDPLDLLPLYGDGAGKDVKDLGKNGSYLVYRQMQQHVYRFWKYLADKSDEDGNTPVERAVKLGAKMVGRWPGGAPLATSPDFDDPQKAEED